MTPSGAEKHRSSARSRTVIATVVLNFCLLFLVSSLQVKAVLLLWRWYFGDTTRNSGPSIPKLQFPLPAHVVPSRLYPVFSDESYFLQKFQQDQEEDTCWRNACSELFPQCEKGAHKERRSRLALVLANCFLNSTGLPQAECPDSKPLLECTASSSDFVRSVLVVFYNKAESICQVIMQGPSMHQSTDASSNKEDAGSSDTARTLNEDLVEKQEKLESTVEELTVIASGAYDVLEMVINSQDQMLDQQRSLALALSQEVARLQAENTDIADSMIEFLKEVPKLKEPAGADDIHLEALAAMDESMSSIQQLSTMARLHKEELASWQSELDAMHQRLADGSSDVLKAQEHIVSQQSVAVESLDNLFVAHDHILDTTKPLKTFLSYVFVASILYFVTNSKQTHGARMLMYCVLLPGLCLEILIIFVQMTDSLKNFQKFNVQLSWIRWVVTALEALSFDSKTHALRDLAFYPFKTAGNRMAKDISNDDPLYRPPRHEGRPRHGYMLRPRVKRPGGMQSKNTNRETVEEFTNLIMNGRPFDEDRAGRWS